MTPRHLNTATWLTVFGACLALSVSCVWLFPKFWQHQAAEAKRQITAHAGSPSSLEELLAQSHSIGQPCDIALLNLLCAETLPGAERLDVDGCLTALDQWAARVKAETERHLYRFRNNPSEFENSEGYFRMLMMSVIVYEDFNVRYNPVRISSPPAHSAAAAEVTRLMTNSEFGIRNSELMKPPRVGPYGDVANDRFFADAQDVFLHGLLGPRRMGTCSSMPVLYVALGHRLGYPVKLVATKGHLFVRWEGRRTTPHPTLSPLEAERETALRGTKGALTPSLSPHSPANPHPWPLSHRMGEGNHASGTEREKAPYERFNLEATGKGMNRYDDEHFRQWPLPLTDAEIAAHGFLQSLTDEEELAAFLSIRAQCLIEAGRQAEAVESLSAAVRFGPRCEAYRLLLAQEQSTLAALVNRTPAVTPRPDSSPPAASLSFSEGRSVQAPAR